MCRPRAVGIRVLLVLLMVSQWVSGQTGSQDAHSGNDVLLLEVVQHNWNIERDETLVFLRVYADGRAEVHPMRKIDFRDISYKRKVLSSKELEALRVLLASPDTVKLEDLSSRSWGGKDFGYEWTIALPQQHRTIRWTNFQPFLARERNEPYPSQQEKLGCAIWRLRVEVSGERLDKDFVRGCDEIGI